MITVPQEWQLPQITQCCPGIGSLGEMSAEGCQGHGGSPRVRGRGKREE